MVVVAQLIQGLLGQFRKMLSLFSYSKINGEVRVNNEEDKYCKNI